MAFGLLTTKWGILRKPLEVSLRYASSIIHSTAILHIYTITCRINHGDYDCHHDAIDPIVPSEPTIAQAQTDRRMRIENILGYLPSDTSTIRGVCFTRDAIVRELENPAASHTH